MVIAPCMASISTTQSCISDDIPSTGCLTCSSDGGGTTWGCGGDGGWQVSVNTFECTP
jgi:hypothetical protein